MAHAPEDQEGRLDLVPMIDCVMLILLFFILTTTFGSADKVIGSLLPTDQGPGTTTKPVPIPPPQVRIAIWPDPLAPGDSAAGYQAQLRRLVDAEGIYYGAALLRIGGGDPIRLDPALLAKGTDDELKARLSVVHDAIARELERYEVAGAGRDRQLPIEIHGFSGLSWRYALLALDAVRAYEAGHGAPAYDGNPDRLAAMRAVGFAPPEIRNGSVRSTGEEMQRILAVR
jgi:hypothetical protein